MSLVDPSILPSSIYHRLKRIKDVDLGRFQSALPGLGIIFIEHGEEDGAATALHYHKIPPDDHLMIQYVGPDGFKRIRHEDRNAVDISKLCMQSMKLNENKQWQCFIYKEKSENPGPKREFPIGATLPDGYLQFLSKVRMFLIKNNYEDDVGLEVTHNDDYLVETELDDGLSYKPWNVADMDEDSISRVTAVRFELKLGEVVFVPDQNCPTSKKGGHKNPKDHIDMKQS